MKADLPCTCRTYVVDVCTYGDFRTLWMEQVQLPRSLRSTPRITSEPSASCVNLRWHRLVTEDDELQRMRGYCVHKGRVQLSGKKVNMQLNVENDDRFGKRKVCYIQILNPTLSIHNKEQFLSRGFCKLEAKYITKKSHFIIDFRKASEVSVHLNSSESKEEERRDTKQRKEGKGKERERRETKQGKQGKGKEGNRRKNEKLRLQIRHRKKKSIILQRAEDPSHHRRRTHLPSFSRCLPSTLQEGMGGGEPTVTHTNLTSSPKVATASLPKDATPAGTEGGGTKQE